MEVIHIAEHPPRLTVVMPAKLKTSSVGTWTEGFNSPKKYGALGYSPATSGVRSKWSYQIVFPLDASRFTLAASLLFFVVGKKGAHCK